MWSLQDTARALLALWLVLAPVKAWAGSMTLLGVGSGSGAPAFSLTAPASGNQTNTSALTTYSFSSVGFGSYDPTRILAAILYVRASTGAIVSSVTIGGQTASKVAGTGSLANNDTEIWVTTGGVTTGTSGTVSVTLNAAGSRMGIQMYSIIGSTTGPVSGVDSTNANPTATLTIPAGGAAIGGVLFGTGGPATSSATPAGFNNNDFNNNIAGAQELTAFHSNAGVISGSTALTISLAGSTAGNSAGAFAAWGP